MYMKINELVNNNKIGKVYVDQDGVLAACDEGLYTTLQMEKDQFFSVTRKDRGDFWKKFLSGSNDNSMEEFFANLGKESNADKLLNFLYSNFDFTILTRPVRPPFRDACIAGKKTWLKKYNVNVPVIFEANKEKYALDKEGRPNILIDDLDENIDKWIAKGGIGLLYENSRVYDTINKLKELFDIKD
jgi:hypothetical protein